MVGSVGLQSGIASDREVTAVTILHDDETGLPLPSKQSGLARSSRETPDPERVIRGVREHLPSVMVRIELVRARYIWHLKIIFIRREIRRDRYL